MPILTVRAHYYQSVVRLKDKLKRLDSYLRGLGTIRRVVQVPGGPVYLLNMDRGRSGSTGYVGEVRMSGVPNACDLAGIERDLRLRDDEGLLEKSYFRFYDDYSLLIWQRTRHTRSPASLASVLSELLGRHVAFYPVIRPAAFLRLMSGETTVKIVELTVARPSNPHLIKKTNPFSARVMDLLATSGGQSMRLRISANARGERGRYLVDAVKQGLALFAESGHASTVKAIVQSDDGEDEVDLLADRLSFSDKLEYVGRNPTDAQVLELLHSARRHAAGELDAFFSSDVAALI